MRSILLSNMFCLISSASWAEAVSWADLVENPGDGLVYKKFLTMPFTRFVMASEDDPVQRSYKDGVKHGEWVEFDANGLVTTKSEYSEGRLQKKVGFEDEKETTEERYEYYENGQLKNKLNYQNGELHGLEEEYYENGQLSFKENFKDDKRHGLQEPFKEDGSSESYNYENGEMIID